MNKVLITIGALVFVVTGLVALVSIHRGSGLVVPGLQPVSYTKDQPVPLKVNKITSHHTQVPFAYFNMEGVCKTEKQEESENLGEIIMGDVSIEHSGYKIPFLKEIQCERVCEPAKLKPAEWAILKQRVRDEYKVHWTLDGLPAAHQYKSNSGDLRWEAGFPLGARENTHNIKAEKKALLYNHAHITIHYVAAESKPGDAEKYRVVFFQVTPASVDYTGAGEKFDDRCTQRDQSTNFLDLQNLNKDLDLELTWSYSVEWKHVANSTWATRWENYIKMQKGEREVHWFSIINSFLIVLFLTGMVAMIMLRTLNADFRRYNSQDPEEADETGWKLVHADVFRPPQRPMLFSALVGNGVQIIGMLVVTMVFAVLGFLSPANHGLLLTAGLVLYVWMGTLAGYFSTRVYKTLKGQNWQKNTVVTAVAFPGTVFGIFFFLNFFLWGQHSSRAIPFGTLVVLIVLWFGISVPLAFFGAYFAWKKPTPDQPVRVNQIPRQVPQQVWYMHPLVSVLLGGILPFGAVFIELFFILASIWLDQFYYLFSFLFIVFIILCLTCAEISIVMCYFQLCSEDYHWWWRSYLTSGASALYMFLYSLFYFTTKLEFSSFLAALLYFGYSLIMSLIFFVLTGTIGYYSCYWFVRKIYSSVKFE